MPPRQLGPQVRTASEATISISKAGKIKSSIQIKQREIASGKSSGRKSSPSAIKTIHIQRPPAKSQNKNLPSLNSSRSSSSQNSQNPINNDTRITNLLNRILKIDPNDHKHRAMLLHSVKLFMFDKNSVFTPTITNLYLLVFISVFSTTPPFSVITKSYRHIYFHPKDHPEDVAVCYQLFEHINKFHPNYSHEILQALVRRLSSASVDDRNGAKKCLISADEKYTPFILHRVCLSLVPPPPHGIDTLLELVVALLKPEKGEEESNINLGPNNNSKSQQPTSQLLNQNSISKDHQNSDISLSKSNLTTPIDSEILVRQLKRKINDSNIHSIYLELQHTIRLLHFAPHFQTYFQTLLSAAKALIDKNESFAHESRRFLLNYWPRLDPQKAVLFLQEATSLCKDGPEIEEYVWQRFSWRSSSIQWQIAMEGLNFIQQTYQRASGFNNNVLVYLLNDTIQRHWNQTVKNKATEVLELIQGTPTAPKLFPLAMWNQLKTQAEQNYPNTDFSGRPKPRKKK